MTCSRGRELFELGRQTEPTRRQALKSKVSSLASFTGFHQEVHKYARFGKQPFLFFKLAERALFVSRTGKQQSQMGVRTRGGIHFFCWRLPQSIFPSFRSACPTKCRRFSNLHRRYRDNRRNNTGFYARRRRRSEPRPPHTATNGPRFSDSSFLLNGWIAMRRCRQPEPSCRRLRGLPSLKLCRSKSHRSRKCRRNR